MDAEAVNGGGSGDGMELVGVPKDGQPAVDAGAPAPVQAGEVQINKVGGVLPVTVNELMPGVDMLGIVQMANAGARLVLNPKACTRCWKQPAPKHLVDGYCDLAEALLTLRDRFCFEHTGLAYPMSPEDLKFRASIDLARIRGLCVVCLACRMALVAKGVLTCASGAKLYAQQVLTAQPKGGG